jgi:hypothetical protein
MAQSSRLFAIVLAFGMSVAAEEENRGAALLFVIRPVAGSVVDPHFADAVPDGADIAGVAAG